MRKLDMRGRDEERGKRKEERGNRKEERGKRKEESVAASFHSGESRRQRYLLRAGSCKARGVGFGAPVASWADRKWPLLSCSSVPDPGAPIRRKRFTFVIPAKAGTQ
jgi:hypothetical protein